MYESAFATGAVSVTVIETMPGLLEFKAFTADDGERVSIIVFDTPEHHDAWRRHPDHVEAQRLGREQFYASYDITVSEVVRRNAFS